MTDGAADLLERVRATGLLPEGAPVVVLLSGGRDSVCLLDVAVRLAGREVVTALHVDYGLRAGSAEDAASCAAPGRSP
jgi:tRNA(Ile)-lysidine synthase